MSKLRDAIRQRLSENAFPHSVRFAVKEEASLQIHALDGKSWVLPWANFVGASHESGEGSEKLLLSFNGHEVLLEGVRLALLLPEIAGSRMKCVWEVEEKFRAETCSTEAFVGRLEVKKLSSRDAAGNY